MSSGEAEWWRSERITKVKGCDEASSASAPAFRAPANTDTTDTQSTHSPAHASRRSLRPQRYLRLTIRSPLTRPHFTRPISPIRYSITCAFNKTTVVSACSRIALISFCLSVAHHIYCFKCAFILEIMPSARLWYAVP